MYLLANRTYTIELYIYNGKIFKIYAIFIISHNMHSKYSNSHLLVKLQWFLRYLTWKTKKKILISFFDFCTEICITLLCKKKEENISYIYSHWIPMLISFLYFVQETTSVLCKKRIIQFGINGILSWIFIPLRDFSFIKIQL